MRMEDVARKGSNAPADLRAWLSYLAERGKLAIAREGIGLADELAAVAKRLERGRFLWPSSADGVATITPAQLGYLLEGIDWRMPQQTWRPQAAG